MNQANTIANEIIDLFKSYGGEEYAGELVTQLEHMYQAGELAAKAGYDEEVILAAFLHDIGHICVSANEQNGMDGWGIKDHVQAKRYLTWKSEEYFSNLSEASKKTLEYQGGRMDESEAMAFEKDPMFDLIVQMRYWDEEAKITDLPVGDLEKYREMMIRHLAV